MDQDIDLTIGSLNFHVGSLGSIRLSDPAKPGPSVKIWKRATSGINGQASLNVTGTHTLARVTTEKPKNGQEKGENVEMGDVGGKRASVP
jgi:hypothetical protein